MVGLERVGLTPDMDVLDDESSEEEMVDARSDSLVDMAASERVESTVTPIVTQP
ncbi:hypothetical protein TanjilG_02962 [Lupinus angustifolius]|uniref:Uncharacterized protein n=1 Tax=Lupinus angustifolius TaxID=3871 RepID=A0A394D9G8_LUPAN|nr:hypothetical protein TanjilG_02962 [Lupinus angustifolius]